MDSKPSVTRKTGGFLRGLFRRAGIGNLPASQTPKHRGAAIGVCLLLSALLWLTFSMRRTSSIVLSLPTRVANLPPAEALVNRPPERVQYVVVGDGLSLLPLYYNPPTVTIDASQDLVDFEVLGPDLPGNVRVETASPRVYQPVREQRAIVTVPIRFVGSIDVPNSHSLTTLPFLDPDSVAISGAESLVNSITSWPTDSFEELNLRDTLSVSLSLSDSLSDLLDLSVQATTFFAVSSEFTRGEREVEVRLTGAPSNRKFVTLDPTTLRVEYRVTLSDYNESLVAPDFYAFVQYDAIRGDTTGRVQPQLALPDGLEIRDALMTPPWLRYYNYLVDE